jgi:hypothetical protein
MDGDALRVVLIALLGAGAAAWIGASFLVRVTGTWIREVSEEERRAGERPETLELKAFGPLVSGQSEVQGGRQEYAGYLIGRTVHLKRRDHGVRYLQNQGYPLAIAEKRDGEEAARLKLKVAGDQLVGDFFPVKIEYTHQPARVTQVLPMAPVARSYTRLAAVPEDEVAGELTDGEAAQG